MKTKLNLLLALVLFGFTGQSAIAQLTVHHIFDNNMILQRDKPARVWGWGNPGDEVKVVVYDQLKTTIVSRDKSWELFLEPMPVNVDPQIFKVSSDGDVVVYQNVLVGDVWILGGQSNMELDLKRIYHGDEEIASANFPNIRILTIPANASPVPVKDFERLNEWDGWHGRYDLKGYWFVCSPKTVPTFSGMGYVFGRRLHMASQVPIALIDASWGGTTVEAWISQKKLLEHPVNQGLIDLWDKKIELDSTKALDRNNPGAAYHGMMEIFGGLTVKGIIFHHGFNNALGDSRPKLYAKNFQMMIEEWRETFYDEHLPFGIIELSAGGQPQTLENFELRMLDAGTFIREAQLKAYKKLENIGFVAAYDQQVNWYHPFKKVQLSERMARWALNTQYGFDFGWEPTLMTGFDVVNKTIILSFDKEVVSHDGRPMEGFAIAGKNPIFYPAKADYLLIGKDDKNRDLFDKTKIVISCENVKKPIAVRYAWARNPLGNLVNGAHTDRMIPVPSFRTDSWDWPEAPFAENKDLIFQKHREKLRDMKRKIEKRK